VWTWAVNQDFTPDHLLRQIERPRPEKRAIHPFSQADVRALLSAIGTSKPYNNHGTTTSNNLPNQDRNRAIILILIDTGIRAEEFCNLKVCDLDTKNLQIKVFG